MYAVDFVEPGTVSTRPVPIARAEFQPAVQRLLVDVRLGRTSPKQAARELLRLLPPPPEGETVDSHGYWRLQTHHGRVFTLVPEKQDGPVRLTPEADEKLKARYLQWCTGQGGGDCLCLLDDGPSLDADDRRAFALALAFGSVLDETREALARELLDVRALLSMVVWTLALYCMLWLVPEPTTKLVAASLTALLHGVPGPEDGVRLDGRLGPHGRHRLPRHHLRGATRGGRSVWRGAAPGGGAGDDSGEILSGTDSNLARHGRRMAGEFFRMLTF